MSSFISTTPWKNIHVELRLATLDEVNGLKKGFLARVFQIVPKIFNTFSLVNSKGYIRDLFKDKLSQNNYLYTFPILSSTYHITSHPKITQLFLKQHREADPHNKC